MPGEGGLLGAGRQLQRAQARLDVRHRRLPERRRHLHRLHDAQLPRRLHAVHGRTPRRHALVDGDQAVRGGRPPTARADQRHGEPRAPLAAQQAQADQRLRPALARLRPPSSTTPPPIRPIRTARDSTADDHHRIAGRRTQTRPARGHVLGSDHPDHRQPGHLHEDRLRQPRGRRVPQHLVAVPRLLGVHEGQGPARRRVHHLTDLRHLRRQPHHLLQLRPADGLRGQAAEAGRAHHQPGRGGGVHLRPHHLPGQPGLRGLLRGDGQGHQPRCTGPRRTHRRAPRRRARLPHHRRDHEGLQPLRGRGLQGGAEGQPDHPGDVLPDGGAPCASLHAVPGGRRHDAAAQHLHRLPQPADARHRLREEGGGDERRRLRLLLRGAAGLRGGRQAPCPAGLLGRVPEPGRGRLPLRHHERVGQGDVRHAGRRRGRQTGHQQPDRHQPRAAHHAGQLLLRGLGERGAVRHPRPAGQPRRHAPPVEPDHGAGAAEAGLRGQLQLGDEPALVPPGHRRAPRPGHRRRPAGPAVVDRAERPGGHAVRQGDRRRHPHHPAQGREAAGDHPGVAHPEVEQHPRTRPRPAVLHRLRRRHGAPVPGGGHGDDAQRRHQGVRELRGAGRVDRLRFPRGGARGPLAPPGDPGQEDRQLPSVPADPVERQPPGHLRHAGPVRGRGAGPAGLRGERPGRLQGRRHHAHRAQLRPLSAVRGAHVHGQGQDPDHRALADVRGESCLTPPSG
ncbi:hypothetical protein SGPA1_21385 [Streptomyces misionensis JCM 4497]